MTSNGLGAKYANINWDHPESACMDIKEVQRCGLPPVIVTASRIYDVYVPPINPPAGDAIGLDPGFYDVTPEQERRTNLAQCKRDAITVRDSCYHNHTRYRQDERDKCEDANSLQHTFVGVGGSVIRRLPGKAKGLLPAYEELAPYVGLNCGQTYNDDLTSDKEKCVSDKEKTDVYCEALHGN